MIRRASILALMFAALLAVEPVLHSHSLQQTNAARSSDASCAICVAGTARLPLVAPTITAPQTLAYTIAVARVQIASADVPLLTASRAPPAA